MKIFFCLLFFLANPIFGSSEDKSIKVSDLSVNQLTQIVRSIVQESIEKCEVKGTMKGRAKVNLKVEGEVLANMTCDFSELKSEN